MADIGMKMTNHLYWLGRYTERASVIIDVLESRFGDAGFLSPYAYREFCESLGIPDRYENTAAFLSGYLRDEDSPFSLMGSLEGAEHNIRQLSGELPSRTLVSIIEGAMERLDFCIRMGYSSRSLAPVADRLFMFWDSFNVMIPAENGKITAIAGRFTERVDLYARFSYPPEVQRRAMNLLLQYVEVLPDTLRSAAVVTALEKRPAESPSGQSK